MVSTCANPECSAPFRHLTQGRLFLVNPRDRRPSQAGRSSSGLQFFWLCEQCIPRFTLAVGPGELVSCVSRSASDSHHRV